MGQNFKRVAVFCAGGMGSGIRGHLANARIPSPLLDMVPPTDPSPDEVKKGPFPRRNARYRNKFSQGGKDKALKASPAAFYTPVDASLSSVGNFDDDLAKIADCDWVVEVIKEELGVKRDLFAKVAKYAHKDAVISSNTS